MACVDLPSSANADSEMEEGEIVDEVDYLSDISSDEEFLLRQRLKVLENYNNALERKEAKKTSIGSGKEHGNKDALYGLSDISGNDVDDDFLKTKFVITKEKKHQKPKRLKQTDKNKEHRKKLYRNKKKVDVSSDSEGSEFPDDDYKNKRRKLADAVSLNIVKNDTSTLKDRLSKMLCISKAGNNNKEVPLVIPECKFDPQDKKINNDFSEAILNSNTADNLANSCIGDDSKKIQIHDSPKENVDTNSIDKKEENSVENSDEDLELLRQHALKTKSVKTKSVKTRSVKTKNDQKVMNDKPELKTDILSEDEDSDTAELRMICLKSTLLKKAIEAKQKKKLQKRLSHTANMNEFDICKSENDFHVDNNTDIESVDMDIGSDEDKGKELISVCTLNRPRINSNEVKNMTNNLRKEDELEEDEDLLRAKLLTSLSKNLPNLVDLNVLNSALGKEATKAEKRKSPCQPSAGVEEKKFIIQLGESDSEGEHEATKNLTKMHIKLSEQAEFQQKLDQFLKSTRLEVEKTKLPDVVQEPVQKPPDKIIVKTMNHLPKSEQIEYKNLVKRMAELEKIKQARQSLINVNNIAAKDTLKPRNFSMATYKIVSAKKVEEKIALSRKRIAEESAKMLKLKEEATKLSQRYKIVATELKNIATAITINKKQQKNVQHGLTKIRHQHQMLLKSSPTKHSNQNLTLGRSIQNTQPTVKLQKENEPLVEEQKKSGFLTSVKVTVPNDLKKDAAPVSPRPVQIEATNNKINMKLPKSPNKDRVVELKKHSPNKNCDEEIVKENILSNTLDKNTDCDRDLTESESYTRLIQPDSDDYKSPLEALQCKNWEEDPNAVLCPFEFGGSCRDPDCKYLHPKIPKQE